MVIDPNSKGTVNANVLNPTATNQSKSAGPDSSAAGPSDDAATLAISSRNLETIADSILSMISDERLAEETTEYARGHILANPTATMSVQANSRPEAVLELLQGVLAE